MTGSGLTSKTFLDVHPHRGRSWRAPSRLDIVLLAATILFVCLAFNGNSLWIDEGYSAYIGSQHRFSDLVDGLRASDSGDLQSVGYYVYLWAWVHLFGFSEFALRASNLPFLVIICVSFWFISTRLFHSQYAWLLGLLCPFLWFYLNEARVYLILMACGSLASAACFIAIRANSSGIRRLAATTCLFMIWAGAVADILAIFVVPGLIFLVWTSRAGRIRETWLPPFLLTLPLFVLDASYILWTLHQPQTQHYDHFNPLYVLLFGYELLGLQGIGPDRNHLRLFSSGTVSTQGLIIAAAVGFICVLATIVLYRNQFRWMRKQSFWLASAGAVSLASLCLVSFVLKERFLPRHASTILPLFLFALIALTVRSRSRTRLQHTFAVLAIGAIWAISDFRLTFNREYEKDDFRNAVQAAIQLSNEPGAKLLWVGDYFTAHYYGLRLSDPIHQLPAKIQPERLSRDTGWISRGNGVFANYFSDFQVNHEIQSATSVDHIYLVATKIDLYDVRHAWAPLILKHGQRLPVNFSTFDFYKLNFK